MNVDAMTIEELRKTRDAVYNRILTLRGKEFEEELEADCLTRKDLATRLVANCFQRLEEMGISAHVYVERGHIGFLRLANPQIKLSPDIDPS